MSLRLVCDYVTLCILCEEPREHVVIERDPESDQERTTRVPLPHQCAEMKALMRERHA